MLIQVDIDNTLYDSDIAFCEAAKEFGVDWPLDYEYWFGPEYVGTDLETLLEIFKLAHSEKYVKQNRPYIDSVETLRGIVEDYDDVEIAYISDRNEKLGEVLKDWLTREGFLFNGHEHVAATKDKREWMRENKPDVVIDDRVRTILMARYEIDAKVIALEYSYNVNLTDEAEGIYIVPDWSAAENVLRDKILV